jgi:ATP-dependent helicase/nuclease subunit A
MPVDQLSLWPELSPSGGAAARAVEPPDAVERRRALDASQSFIVQAPAGSGKTELLIQRYLTLLASASSPEAVVAITFTIKAAGEMRTRVLDALEAARGAEPEAAHQRLTWNLARAVLEQDSRAGWALLQNSSRMRIQTIDALNMAITRQMPWLARMGAMPDVTDDARVFYERAAEATIRLLGEDTRDSAAVECLLRHLDYEVASARSLLAAMLEIRDHWLPITGIDPDVGQIRASLESQLASIVRERLGRVRASFPPDAAAALPELIRFAASNLDPSHPAYVCRDIDSLPSSEPENAPLWRGIASLILTDKGEFRKRLDKNCGFPSIHRVMKDRFERLLQSLASTDIQAAFDTLRTLPADRYPDSQWEVLEALLRLLPRAAAELRVAFSQSGVVDFIEISQAALNALGGASHPTDLALALGCRIEHLLVDEFQDTSRAQYELLRVLTAGWEDGDGRTLFLVGDPMQSIYRFRQADVGLYLSIRERGLEAVRPAPVWLSTNFRSAPAIVDWVNATFKSAFPAEEDSARGGVPYSASEAFRMGVEEAGVYVHPIIGRNDSAEADLVLNLIQRERSAGSSIAVLVRARTHLLETADRLRKLGIPFRAIEIDSCL